MGRRRESSVAGSSDPSTLRTNLSIDVTAPLVESASPYTYEWVFPNSEDGKYFTTTQARMYVRQPVPR